MSEQTFTVSNPRKEETIEDWPLGSNRRGPAQFIHETKASKGQRIGRITANKFGQPCKTKYSTYADVIRLVDGSDDRTHLLSFSSGFIQVRSCDMKHDDFSVFEGDDNFVEYRKMLFADTDTGK